MKERILETVRTIEKNETTVNEALRRSVVEILPTRASLEKKIKEERIKLYLGIDPTSPNLHLGHTVPLRKLRHFQDLGHDVRLLFGTFTGMIGDPSDKSAARVQLTPEQININVKTYKEQASKILDLSDNAANPVTIEYNHEWLGKMNFAEVVDLMSNFSVQQILERKGFQNRMEKGDPVWVHEIIYPMMQGQDAVAMEVDLEVGGSDQTFNMLVGRDLVRRYLDKDKWVMATKLLTDPDGKKIGKTEGNMVNITDWPEVKFEGLMLLPDSAMGIAAELLTTIPLETAIELQQTLPAILNGEMDLNIMDLKKALTYRIISELDGEAEATYGLEEFERVKQGKELPRRIREVSVQKGDSLTDVLVACGAVDNEGEAAKKLSEGAVYVDRKRVKENIKWSSKYELVQLGKRTIKNIFQVSTK